MDGCYSHWVGGCWPLIEAALSGSTGPSAQSADDLQLPTHQQSLYSREGLIRYTMCCCQDLSKRGGLRDKPGRYVIILSQVVGAGKTTLSFRKVLVLIRHTITRSPSDAYHTCYVLSGLSSAQHKWELVTPSPAGGIAASATAGSGDEKTAAAAAALASWSVSPDLDEVQVFDEEDRIVPLHPVYAVPAECVADIKAFFGAKQGF